MMLVNVEHARNALSGWIGGVIDTDVQRFGRMYVGLAAVGCRLSLARSLDRLQFRLQHEPVPWQLVFISVDRLGAEHKIALNLLRVSRVARAAIIIGVCEGATRHDRRRLLSAGYDGCFGESPDMALFAQQLLAAVPGLMTQRPAPLSTDS